YSDEELAGPNPFDPDDNTTLYAEYGWGGYRVHNYDPEQHAPTCATGPLSTSFVYMVANWSMTGIAVMGAIATFLVRVAFSPDTFSLIHPVLDFFTSELGMKVAFPLMVLGVVVTLVWAMFKSRHGEVVTAAKF